MSGVHDFQQLSPEAQYIVNEAMKNLPAVNSDNATEQLLIEIMASPKEAWITTTIASFDPAHDWVAAIVEASSFFYDIPHSLVIHWIDSLLKPYLKTLSVEHILEVHRKYLQDEYNVWVLSETSHALVEICLIDKHAREALPIMAKLIETQLYEGEHTDNVFDELLTIHFYYRDAKSAGRSIDLVLELVINVASRLPEDKREKVYQVFEIFDK